ncbi:MAG: hypothetical protein M0P14_02810 [Alkaliphilus sp.]|nr:hypothetical protein [Alkaliphilus sp.]
MVYWSLIGQYVLLFLVDGIAGYFLQLMAYTLAIHAFNKRQITVRTFFLMTVIFSIFSFAIRNIPCIKFGYHTILITIMCVIFSYTLFKTEIYPTILAVFLTMVSNLFFEALVFGISIKILGNENFSKFFVNIETTAELICRALLGVPANILLLIEMFIIYKYYLKKIKKDGLNRAIGENDNL